MGKLIVGRRYVGWVTERYLSLTREDLELREKRRKRKQDGEICPDLLPWHHAFMRHLEKCPLCGNMPYVAATWRPKDGYDYKIQCENDCGLINCGDWYPQLSRAGLDWNYRARKAAGGPHKCCPHYK